MLGYPYFWKHPCWGWEGSAFSAEPWCLVLSLNLLGGDSSVESWSVEAGRLKSILKIEKHMPFNERKAPNPTSNWKIHFEKHILQNTKGAYLHPWKFVHGTQTWRFGSDDFPSQIGGFSGFMSIFRAVVGNHQVHQPGIPSGLEHRLCW